MMCHSSIDAGHRQDAHDADGGRADEVGARSSGMRRSYRSEKTPPMSTKSTSGRVQATPTIDRAVGTLLIS